MTTTKYVGAVMLIEKEGVLTQALVQQVSPNRRRLSGGGCPPDLVKQLHLNGSTESKPKARHLIWPSRCPGLCVATLRPMSYQLLEELSADLYGCLAKIEALQEEEIGNPFSTALLQDAEERLQATLDGPIAELWDHLQS
jgi:hypothetical protein